MATLVTRNVPEHVRHGLKKRAAEHNRSMEAEVRAILEEAVAEKVSWVREWLDFSERFRAEHGGVDLPLPERSAPRDLDLFS